MKKIYEKYSGLIFRTILTIIVWVTWNNLSQVKTKCYYPLIRYSELSAEGIACKKTIDDINIRQSTLTSMHNAVNNIITSKKLKPDNIRLLVDGNDFKPMVRLNNKKVLSQINHICIEGGDNKYTAIAAASILAKVERDKYIEEFHSEVKEKFANSLSKIYNEEINYYFG